MSTSLLGNGSSTARLTSQLHPREIESRYGGDLQRWHCLEVIMGTDVPGKGVGNSGRAQMPRDCTPAPKRYKDRHGPYAKSGHTSGAKSFLTWANQHAKVVPNSVKEAECNSISPMSSKGWRNSPLSAAANLKRSEMTTSIPEMLAPDRPTSTIPAAAIEEIASTSEGFATTLPPMRIGTSFRLRPTVLDGPITQDLGLRRSGSTQLFMIHVATWLASGNQAWPWHGAIPSDVYKPVTSSPSEAN